MRISDWSSDVCSSDLILAEGLPHHAAPARLEGAHHVVFLVGRRRRGEPEGIGRLYAGDLATQVSHGGPPRFARPSPPPQSSCSGLTRASRATAPSLNRKLVVLGNSVTVRVYLGGRRYITKQLKKH